MSHFRLVILDYAKEQLDNPQAQKVLSDMIFTKQKNFLRTDPNYVVMDKHDMIGTHYLIYDVKDFMNPKLIFAMRTTFLDRSQQHGVLTPLQSLVPTLDTKLQNAYKDFQKRHPQLVDCNSWFVDPGYSKKNSGLSLSDVGYFMAFMNIHRFGFDNAIGCTNETYNASRWLEPLGDSPKDLLFEHPVVKAPHKMLLVENFNIPHYARVYQEYKELFDELYEIAPEAHRPAQTLSQFVTELFEKTKVRAVPDAA
jgi:hypothetical protein